ncbi:quinolinate synthase NadA [bacterium]|nr:quinolinate synthase NadA [bacterium]
MGRNTANALAFPARRWSSGTRARENGGLSGRKDHKAIVILWKGLHHGTYPLRWATWQAHQEHPGCKVIVHPECTKVVAAADRSGSTNQMVRVH